MNIKLIDQVLNAAIASLIYGSEMWFVCAFSLYVVGRSKQAKASAVGKDLGVPDTGNIEISIIQSAEAEPVAIVPAEKAVPETTSEQSDLKQSSLNLSSTTSVQPVKVSANQRSLQAIDCEPVDWKKWKVGDLRKANIAKVCSVRTRPIGSRRNLAKADLIAQYEQNLKRLTKSPPEQITNQNMIA